jgi:hypothetical protein
LLGKRPHSESRMSTRADDYRQSAPAADRRAAQTSDPRIRGAYEQITRDWLALAEQVELDRQLSTLGRRPGGTVLIGRHRLDALRGCFQTWRVSRPDQCAGMHRGYSVGITRRGCATGPLSKGRRAAQLPERPSSACSSSTLRGDLRTSAPGAYLPAVSASGTCAYRRAARAARRPDLMDKPSLQTSQAIAGTRRTATPALLSRARYARCSSFPQGRDGCTAVQNPRVVAGDLGAEVLTSHVGTDGEIFN